MLKKAKYTIQCSNCKGELPILITIDTEQKAKEGITSREVTCPFCETLLTFKLQETIAPNEVILKSYKKAD